MDGLAEWMGSSMSETERKEMLATVAMLKLAGVEEKAEDGSVLHRFAVSASSAGALTVNGKDLSPLLGLGGGEEQGAVKDGSAPNKQ